MRKLLSVRILLISGALTIALNACQKETSVNPINDGTAMNNNNTGAVTANSYSSKSDAFAEQSSQDIPMLVDDAYAINNSNPAAKIGGCAHITVDMESSPHKITIDFGTTNCLGKDGHYRRGKIFATFDGDYRAEGTMISYTTLDYYVDNNRVDALVGVTNMGRNANGHLHFQVSANTTVVMGEVSKTSLTIPGSIKYEMHRDQEWIEGESTAVIYDDVYLITGTAKSTENTSMIESEIIVPLRKESAYRFYVWGVEKFTRTPSPDEASLTATVDYGYPKGGRDDLALVTYADGSTKVIHLDNL